MLEMKFKLMFCPRVHVNFNRVLLDFDWWKEWSLEGFFQIKRFRTINGENENTIYSNNRMELSNTKFTVQITVMSVDLKNDFTGFSVLAKR